MENTGLTNFCDRLIRADLPHKDIRQDVVELFERGLTAEEAEEITESFRILLGTLLRQHSESDLLRQWLQFFQAVSANLEYPHEVIKMDVLEAMLSERIHFDESHRPEDVIQRPGILYLMEIIRRQGDGVISFQVEKMLPMSSERMQMLINRAIGGRLIQAKTVSGYKTYSLTNIGLSLLAIHISKISQNMNPQ